MIDPAQIALDISGNAVSLALPGILWAALFLLAFDHPEFAESVGFGRRAFWLLLPGALLGTLAFLPIAPIANDWLAISFAGALFPLFLAGLAFARFAPPLRRSLSIYVAAVGVAAIGLLLLVLPFADSLANGAAGLIGGSLPAGQNLVVVIAAALAALTTVTIGVRGGLAGRVAFVLALTLGVIALTFVASVSLPGVGIEEAFPIYLVPPIGAGAVAVLVAGSVFPGEEGFALPVAYVASTVGVLIGADVLRQPPLYTAGPSGLYTIGGAGVLDLVYLSGLLGLAAAYGVYRLTGGALGPVGPALPALEPGPFSRLIRAFKIGLAGDADGALRNASQAARDAAGQASRLLGTPPTDPARPWAALPVPGWIVSDDANLAAAAAAGTSDGREAFRGWITARWLVQLGQELGLRRFASVGARVVAFAIDLTIVGAPALAIWVALALSTPGNLAGLLANIPFNAAAYGFVAVAFLYFVLAERLAGTTPGKWLLGLVVRDRTLGRPGLRSLLVRNAPLLPPLTVIGVGVPVAVAFLTKAGGAASVALLGIPLPTGVYAFALTLGFVVGGVALLGVIGILMMAVTSERQRLGDLMAGTWVLRSGPVPAPAG